MANEYYIIKSQGVQFYYTEPNKKGFIYFYLKNSPDIDVINLRKDILNIFIKNNFLFNLPRTGAKATRFEFYITEQSLSQEQDLFNDLEKYLVNIDYKGILPKRGRKAGSKNKPVLIPVSSTPLPKNDEIVLPDGSVVKVGDIFMVNGEFEKYTILDINQNKNNVKLELNGKGTRYDLAYTEVDKYFGDGTYIKKGAVSNPVTTSSNTAGYSELKPGLVYVNMSDIKFGDLWKLNQVVGFSQDKNSHKIQANLITNGGLKDRISKEGFELNLKNQAYIPAYNYYSNKPINFYEFITSVSEAVREENNWEDYNEIKGSQDNQKKYVDGVLSLIEMLDINNLSFTDSEKKEISDDLTNGNFHLINNFLALYGFLGSKEKETYSRLGNKSPFTYLNPDLFTIIKEVEVKPDDIAVQSIVIDKGVDLRAKEMNLKAIIEDMVFIRDNIPPAEFERRVNLNTEIDKVQKELDDVLFRISEEKKGHVNLLDSLFEQATTPVKKRYDNLFSNEESNYFAPNGNKSKYSIGLYEYINSPEFKEWFGNYLDGYTYRNIKTYTPNHSVVLNEDYEPKLVWHGTGQEFSYFNFDKFPAAYFAENYYYSLWFAEQKGGIGNGYVYPFFINIRKPLDLSMFGIQPVKNKIFFDYIFLKTGLDETKLKMNPVFLDPEMPPVQAWVYLRNNPQFLVQLSESHVYDGIIYYEDNPANPRGAKDYETKAYIIFKPEQAKLADPDKGELTFASMKSFMLKKGGKL